LYIMGICSVDPAEVRVAVGETVYPEWLKLDALLAGLWESHPVCLEFGHKGPWSMAEERLRMCQEILLLELAKCVDCLTGCEYV
jgi:hypothetical protein